MKRLALLALAACLGPASARADDPPAAAPAAQPIAFLRDIAPILARQCIACHNPRKAEGKYVMTTFAQLAKGGQQGADVTLEPGKPDESYFVELIRPQGSPRMPYKQDPLPAAEVALIERWVAEGAKYDGSSPSEDWPTVLRRNTPVSIPEKYPVPVPITALQYAPGGSEILAAGYHELTGWKAGDGSPTRRIRPLDERVHDVALAPGGAWMATASGDPGQAGTVKLWAVGPDGAITPGRTMLEAGDGQFTVAFSPDGARLAAAGADRTVRVWEVATGTLQATIEDHADWIFDVAFSPDGRRLATASRDKTAKVFDLEKKESLATFPGHAEAVTCVSFTPDGKSVVTAGGDSIVRVWNPDEDAKQTRVVGGFGGPVFRLQFHPDGKRLIATGADRVVRVFENFEPKQALTGHNDWVYGMALSPDGNTLATGSWDGEVRTWDLAAGKPIRTILAAPGIPTPAPPAATAAK